MKTLALLAALALFSPALLAQGAPPQVSADKPYVMEYYYKVSWGHQKEFLDLFLKNHFPILQKIQGIRPHPGSQNRNAIQSYDRRIAVGLSRHHHLQKFHGRHHRQSRRRSHRSTNSIPTRPPTIAKSSAASRFSSPTGIFP